MRRSVIVKPSEHQFYVEKNETVLDAALRQGVNLRYGCRNGACGSCKGKIVSGSVNYDSDDVDLSEEDINNNLSLFCQAHPQSDLTIEVEEIDLEHAVEIKTLPCRVQELNRLCSDVIQILIKLPAAERLQFLAGQYIDILLEDGRHRSFSIANPPHDDEFIELHVRLVEDGFFTTKVFTQMQEKDLLRIEGPHGSFFFQEESSNPILLMAGGTGFAPIKSIVEHLIKEQITRPVILYWGVRSKADCYMHDLASKWMDEHENIQFILVLSEPANDDHWEGKQGYVHEAVMQDIDDLSAYDVYACGPPQMIKAAAETFQTKGMNPDRFYYDSFDFANE